MVDVLNPANDNISVMIFTRKENNRTAQKKVVLYNARELYETTLAQVVPHYMVEHRQHWSTKINSMANEEVKQFTKCQRATER